MMRELLFFLQTKVSSVKVENGIIKCVEAKFNTFSIIFEGKQFIDASGDGDVAALSGCKFDYTWISGAPWLDGRNYGFAGTFDGRGFTVNGLKLSSAAGGFIGLLNTNGVIKNVSFINSTVNSWGGFVTDAGNGRIENVNVSYSSFWVGDAVGTFYACDCMGDARVINCFVETKCEITGTLTNYNLIGKVHGVYGIYNNVYAVGSEQGYTLLSSDQGTNPGTCGAYANRNDFKSNVSNISTIFNNGYWTVDGEGIPTFRAKTFNKQYVLSL